MKHAYLIIAHNEFEVLQLLVSALDDVQNDFFIHFDKKVRKLPQLFCQHSRLFVLENRVDVRWGSVSQIKCEMLLFEEARQMGSYDYYHMISGTHLPLKSVAELDLFFQDMKGYCVLTGFVKDTEYQETLKIHRINLFLRHYASPRPWLSRVSQFVWKSCIALQRVLHVQVNRGESFYKASNWLSLTEEAVDMLLLRKKAILRKYRYTLCGDEFFVPSELMNSPLKDMIKNDDCLLKQEMQRANPRVYSLSEWDGLKKTAYLFARKFTSQ